MNEWTPANSHEEAANRIKTLELIPRLRKLYDVLLEGTNAYPGYDRLVAASDIERVIAENERLEAINVELLAACEAYVRLIGNCGDPTQYSGSFENLLAAIAKAQP